MIRRTLRRPRARLYAAIGAAALVTLALTHVTAAPSASAATLSCMSASTATVQKQILTEVNAARKAAGAKPLTESAKIDTVAMNWSASQAKANAMSHNPKYSAQMPAGWSTAGENVAYGYAYNKVTTAWMNSSGHRANILNTSFTHIGIGVACSSKGQAYYTQNFGAYKTSPDPVAKLPAGVERESGADRYSTSAAVSKSTFAPGVAVAYLANGTNFPDALSGAAAAGAADAPVLLTDSASLPSAIASELSRLKPKKIVVLGGPSAVSNAVLNAAKSYTSGSVTRVSGQNRYETSAATSRAAFDPGVDVAYLTNGTTFPDALSGAAAAGTLGGPVLLVQAGSIPAAVKTELGRLAPKRIVILGGTSAVSAMVASAAKSYTTGTVTRSAGDDRYATAADVSKKTFAKGVSVAYVANGTTFPDALSGAAAAGTQDGPVLLTNGTSLSAAVKNELARLKPDKIVVLGGTSAVSAGVATALGGYVG